VERRLFLLMRMLLLNMIASPPPVACHDALLLLKDELSESPEMDPLEFLLELWENLLSIFELPLVGEIRVFLG